MVSIVDRSKDFPVLLGPFTCRALEFTEEIENNFCLINVNLFIFHKSFEVLITTLIFFLKKKHLFDFF